ncbi:5-methylcytosine-specific restriction endonuclease system specificity protein McrC [Acidocella sp.]|uniref:5-methylcytosine-specific restriction endonuclease system specificity protein McrC n=1 Tax=Acidocella sp. TaxID=50710 RepID=UPI00262BFBAA|nr:5-methylcytosine-specific restriction endonuclease system specificity protein McrC [Acidocella sp.]
MLAQPAAQTIAEAGYVGRIPVRNLWLLMLYASDLTRSGGPANVLFENDVEDLPGLVARLLADAVERRLRQNMTRSYRHREQALSRVRGRIDLLETESRQLLSKGMVFCRFEELTTDTPRNRLVRAALDFVGRLVDAPALSHRCKTLAADLARLGVGGGRPSRVKMAAEQIGRNDAADRLMVSLARLVFELALPTEIAGPRPFLDPSREEAWVRRLFEKAVFGMARAELEPLGWRVRGGLSLAWQVSSASEGLAAILPRMVTDIVLDTPGGNRLVIDTKFTSILTSNRFGSDTLKSGYLYQLYAYLRSQEGLDKCWEGASGLLLHPAVGASLRAEAMIQGHTLRFATVDLGEAAGNIRSELKSILLS